MIYKAVPPALQSPRNMCCWHSTRKCLFLQSKGPVTGSANQVGWLSYTQRKNWEGRKKESSLPKLVTADQPLFPMFLKSWASISRPCHAEAQITHLSWLLLCQAKGTMTPAFRHGPPAWGKCLFIHTSWGGFFVRIPWLVLAIWTRLAMTCY